MKELTKTESALTLSTLQGYEESFIDYLDVDNLTLTTYKVGIENFINYLKENNISFPTREDIISYRNHLRETYQDNTVNSYMTSLRRLFKYLSLKRLYEDLTIDIKGARHTSTPKKQVLTQQQASEIYKGLTDKRERALYSLLISTGLRGVEVARAKLEDIKVHNGEIVLWVQCKKRSSKNEYVKLDKQVLQDIMNYVGDRQEGYIFVSTSNNNKGQGVSIKTIRREINKIFERFGVKSDTISLHSTRRTFATISYNNGVDLKDIQDILHHASLTTTQRYINSAIRDNNNGENIVANVILRGGA
jgi:site-specific recombinase XerD